MKTIKEILTKGNGVLKLAVHNGVFHADDVLCIAIIKSKMKELGVNREVKVIRSRNSKALAQADIIMDVGNGKYDHHSPDNPIQKNGVKMSACGKIADELYDGEELKMLHDMVLDPVQASDNGQKRSDLKLKENLFSWISFFNPNLSESPSIADERFNKAVEIAGEIFNKVLFTIREIISDKEKMERTLAKYFADESQYSSNILNIGKMVHWQETVCAFNTTNPDKKVKVIVYKTPTGQWNSQSVPTAVGSFDNLAPMPMKYAKKEVKLPKDTIFVHQAGFIAGHKTEEAAMEMAKEAIALAKDSGITKMNVF